MNILLRFILLISVLALFGDCMDQKGNEKAAEQNQAQSRLSNVAFRGNHVLVIQDKEKNVQKVQTSNGPASARCQNEAISSPKKPSPNGKSINTFGLNLAKHYSSSVIKAHVGEEAQSSNGPKMNRNKCEKNEENAQTPKDPTSETHEKLAKEITVQKAETSKDPTSAGDQNEAIAKKPSPKAKSESDFGQTLANALQSSVMKDKNVQKAETSKDPPTSAGGQNEAIAKKPSPKAKSENDFGRNLAKAYSSPLTKASKLGEEAQSLTDPTMNDKLCHRFHWKCAKSVDGLLLIDLRCPICREEVDGKNLFNQAWFVRARQYEAQTRMAIGLSRFSVKIGEKPQSPTDPEKKKNYNCIICLGRTLDGVEYSNCKHLFHRKCIDELFKMGSDKCPICHEGVASTYKLTEQNQALARPYYGLSRFSAKEVDWAFQDYGKGSEIGKTKAKPRHSNDDITDHFYERSF
ncbi:hypothetical protein niasHT_018764 [Heterodera trifolii]|uniref:RING-type domain-containing protein n=1 Tax=Heterodera trifolii TaxID=157864 RepID=A0ABD2LB48_9BILA